MLRVARIPEEQGTDALTTGGSIGEHCCRSNKKDCIRPRKRDKARNKRKCEQVTCGSGPPLENPDEPAKQQKDQGILETGGRIFDERLGAKKHGHSKRSQPDGICKAKDK